MTKFVVNVNNYIDKQEQRGGNVPNIATYFVTSQDEFFFAIEKLVEGAV